MKKSKLFSLMAAIVVISIGFISCGDDFQEPLDPTPVPIEKKMVLNLNIDFPSFENVIGFSASTIVYREELEYNTGATFFNTDWQGQELKQDFSVTLLGSIDSLKGKTCEICFMVQYEYEGALWAAELIREVTFSSSDTTNLGNVGFSNYTWYTHPPLVLVVVPDNIKQYASY